MSHEYLEHNRGDHEDPLAGPTWTVGIIGVVMFAVTVLGVAALFYTTEDEEFAEKVLTENEFSQPGTLEILEAAQSARLEALRRELRPENEGDISIVIPVEDAVELVLDEAGGGR